MQALLLHQLNTKQGMWCDMIKVEIPPASNPPCRLRHPVYRLALFASPLSSVYFYLLGLSQAGKAGVGCLMRKSVWSALSCGSSDSHYHMNPITVAIQGQWRF